MLPRDQDTERRERFRYRFLERLYLLTGADCKMVAYDWQIEQELGLAMGDVEYLVGELERLGYLKRFGGGSQMCISERGIEYLSRGAWRRRSIRN
jgi:hypothetical protein